MQVTRQLQIYTFLVAPISFGVTVMMLHDSRRCQQRFAHGGESDVWAQQTAAALRPRLDLTTLAFVRLLAFDVSRVCRLIRSSSGFVAVLLVKTGIIASRNEHICCI